MKLTPFVSSSFVSSSFLSFNACNAYTEMQTKGTAKLDMVLESGRKAYVHELDRCELLISDSIRITIPHYKD